MTLPQQSFPIITGARYGANRRGPVLFLTLDGVGAVELTPRQLLHPKRFTKAVLKQSEAELHPPPAHVWRAWLHSCLQRAREVRP
jgi:hypothetical protein